MWTVSLFNCVASLYTIFDNLKILLANSKIFSNFPDLSFTKDLIVSAVLCAIIVTVQIIPFSYSSNGNPYITIDSVFWEVVCEINELYVYQRVHPGCFLLIVYPSIVFQAILWGYWDPRQLLPIWRLICAFCSTRNRYLFFILCLTFSYS